MDSSWCLALGTGLQQVKANMPYKTFVKVFKTTNLKWTTSFKHMISYTGPFNLL